MAANDHTSASVDLGRLSLGSGQGARLDLEIAPEAIALGGHEYALEQPVVSARVDVSRTAAGYALRLRFAAAITGPCMRCLETATPRLEIDAREVDQPSSGDEELTSPYVEDEVLDLASWAHDAIALALPTRILCREDCAGLCPVCGGSLNDAEPGAHDHPRDPDPRWAKLRELQ